MQEKYAWLDPSNERKYMLIREILEKYVDLEKSYLTDEKRIRLWTCYMDTRKQLV